MSTDVTFLTNPPAVYNTDTIEVYDSSDVHDTSNSIHENVTSAIEDFQQRGSGWVLDKLLALDLHLLEFDPHSSSCTHAEQVISIRNNDEKCILWSEIAGLYFKHVELHHLERTSHLLVV